jgi:hypothetical protein
MSSASAPVPGLDDGVPLALQDLARQGPHHLVVLREQDRLRAPATAAGRRRRHGLGRLEDARQIDLEGGAEAGLGVDGDGAVALLHDPVDGGQAEPGALARRLRGEEGLEDPGPDLLGHPDAGVAHREHHVGAGGDVGMEPRVVFVQLHVLGLDRELPALGHGVPSVHDEIEEDLLHLRRVGLDAAQAAGRRRDEVDVLADEASEHGLDLADDGVQIQDLRSEHLLPAEGEELAREVGRVLGGLLDEADPPVQGIARREPTVEEVGMAPDHGEEIVEVVRQPAGQASDALHLLGPAGTAPPAAGAR